MAELSLDNIAQAEGVEEVSVKELLQMMQQEEKEEKK